MPKGSRPSLAKLFHEIGTIARKKQSGKNRPRVNDLLNGTVQFSHEIVNYKVDRNHSNLKRPTLNLWSSNQTVKKIVDDTSHSWPVAALEAKQTNQTKSLDHDGARLATASGFNISQTSTKSTRLNDYGRQKLPASQTELPQMSAIDVSKMADVFSRKLSTKPIHEYRKIVTETDSKAPLKAIVDYHKQLIKPAINDTEASAKADLVYCETTVATSEEGKIEKLLKNNSVSVNQTRWKLSDVTEAEIRHILSQLRSARENVAQRQGENKLNLRRLREEINSELNYCKPLVESATQLQWNLREQLNLVNVIKPIGCRQNSAKLQLNVATFTTPKAASYKEYCV